ncbi:tyrosine-type recombinase/integrase [Streptomyces fuscigenes]|uniref:tyrosine-type recombinase/integrase n=1 Tax=Streptomyces fuscigenes TaxID=1528880 RepID=UPI001F3328EA|nr:tyrosine-type recombinase/integrase [Streptomyces fuscigenes]MCF3960230.1 site-specific integrase [Streptomyces fuscigenes]
MSKAAIDESSLLSAGHVRTLLEWIQQESSGAVFSFLASMAGTALSPGEAASVRVHDVALPDGEFGEVLVRAGEGRRVPVSPDIVGVLRRWIDEANLEAEDLLFPADLGGPLASSEYKRAWRQARHAVLSPDEVQAGLGEQVSSLRDSCLDRWLEAGVPAWAVAEWAGVSASWIALRYPQRFRLEDVEIDWDQLEEIMGLPDFPER